MKIEQEIIDVGQMFVEGAEGIIHRKTTKKVQFRRRGIQKYNIRKGIAILNPQFEYALKNCDVVKHIKKEIEVKKVKENT